MSKSRRASPELEARYKKQGSCCYYCRSKIPFTYITRDHVLPKSQGHHLNDNSVFACYKCNTAKGHLSLEDFKAVILKRLVSMLKNIVKNKFIATQSIVDKFKHNHRILMSIVALIANDGKPVFK